MRRIWINTVPLALLTLGCAQTAALSKKGVFDYSWAKPYPVTITEIGSGLRSQRISFPSVNGFTASGILNVPNTAKKPPVLLLLHGLGSSAEQVSQSAAPIAMLSGYATLALDAPGHGARKRPNEQIFSSDLNETRRALIAGIIEYRMAMDYLETRSDVDASRIVLLGASLGGIMGALVAGSDTRVDAAALLIAGGNFRELAKSTLPEVAPFRRSIESASGVRLDDIDPVNWVGRISPRPVLLINGLKDDVVPKAAAEALIRNAKEPKTVVWDDVGHTISPTRFGMVYQWLLANTPK